MQTDVDGHTGEGFRFPLSGSSVKVDVYGRDIFEDEELQDVHFLYEIEADRLEIRPNATSSKWEDFEELLGRGTVIAIKTSSNEDITPDIRKRLHGKKTSPPSFGAALRWSLQAKHADHLTLVLQCLPRSAGMLRRDARLYTDFAGAIELARLRVETPMRLDEPCRGPIPILFARDPDLTRENLLSHPENL
jgi:hypothetical protein